MLTSALILSLMLSPAAEVVERDEAAIQPQSQGPQLGWGMNQGAAPPRGGTPEPTPVSYTHLTLPTNREV